MNGLYELIFYCKISKIFIFLAVNQIPPCESGLICFVHPIIATLTQIRPFLERCGASGCLQQCHPGLNAYPVVFTGLDTNHLFKGKIANLSISDYTP